MKITTIILKILEQFSLYDSTEELSALRIDLEAWHNSCTKDSKGFDLLYYKFFKDNLAIRCLAPLLYFFAVDQVKKLLSNDDDHDDPKRFQ